VADLKQKDLVLILARELVSQIMSPVFLIDADGTLIYFNEHAQMILGQSFEEVGELPAADWGRRWEPRDLDGREVPLKALPLSVTLLERKPAHGPLRIKGSDGVEHEIEVTSFPLLSKQHDFVGAVAIFWERAG